MEAIAIDADRLIPPRDGQEPGHTGHVAMKRGVKACKLRHGRALVAEGLDQQDFGRQVFRYKRAEPPQFSQHLAGDRLGLPVSAPPCTTRWPIARRPASLNRRSSTAINGGTQAA